MYENDLIHVDVGRYLGYIKFNKRVTTYNKNLIFKVLHVNI